MTKAARRHLEGTLTVIKAASSRRSPRCLWHLHFHSGEETIANGQNVYQNAEHLVFNGNMNNTFLTCVHSGNTMAC